MHAGEAMGVGGFGIQFMRQPCGGKGVGKISLGDEVAGLFMANGGGALEAGDVFTAGFVVAQMLPTQPDAEQYDNARRSGKRAVAANG